MSKCAIQTEAGEVFEPSAPGKGGSSTIPHKRNPLGAAVLISAIPQEHERSLGLWHSGGECDVPSRGVGLG